MNWYVPNNESACRAKPSPLLWTVFMATKYHRHCQQSIPIFRELAKPWSVLVSTAFSGYTENQWLVFLYPLAIKIDAPHMTEGVRRMAIRAFSDR